MSMLPDAERNPLQAWLDITEAAPAGESAPVTEAPRLSRRLLWAAGLACAIAIGLGVAVMRAPAVPAEPGPVASLAPVEPAASAQSHPDAARSGPTDLEATTAAVMAVRLNSPPDLYVDTAVPEATAAVGSTTIVTVSAVVLPRTARGWGAAQPARYAVAVSAHSDLVGGPWPLPPAAARDRAANGTWEPAPDLRDAATAALQAAGYRRLDAVAARRNPDLDGIVSVICTALAPGEPTARRHDVWLTSDAGHVLGAARPTPPLPVPLEQP